MKAVVERVLLFLLGAFFLYAGAVKLWDVAAFTQSIEQYRLVTGSTAWVLALWIPWAECLAGTALWIKGLRVGSLWILAALLLVFEGILLTALLRGLDISCGCLGSGGEGGVLLAFLRNVLLLAMVFGLLFFRPRSA